VLNIGSKIYPLYLQSEMPTNIQHVFDCKMIELEDRTAAGFLCQYSHEHCERSVGTVFQLPNPDAIYSRDEEKERKVGCHLMFVFAHGPRAAEAR
jgi:hypothetical protein